MKYPMIEKLGLQIQGGHLEIGGKGNPGQNEKWIDANDLEALLSKAQRVYARKPDGVSELWNIAGETNGYDTHTALLIAVEPIVRGVRKSEIIDLLRETSPGGRNAWEILADRIEREGIIDG